MPASPSLVHGDTVVRAWSIAALHSRGEATSSPDSAVASGAAVSSICHARAPSAANASPTESTVIGVGRLPGEGADELRAEEVLGREVVLLGQRGDDLAAAAEPAGGLGVLLGPGPRRRRAVASWRVRGSSASGERQARSMASCHWLRNRRGPRLRMILHLLELADGSRGIARDLEDRGVGQDASGRDVALLGDGVAGLPDLADQAERAASAGLVDAGRAPPRLLALGRAR